MVLAVPQSRLAGFDIVAWDGIFSPTGFILLELGYLILFRPPHIMHDLQEEDIGAMLGDGWLIAWIFFSPETM